MKPPRWACFEALLILWLAALCGSVAAADGVTRLDRADFVMSDSAGPPPDSADWKPVTLPDAWWVSRPGVTGDGWYRLTWALDAPPSRALAIYLPKLGRVGEAYVNGHLVGQSAIVERPELISRPQLFAVDPALLHAGNNTIHLLLRTTPMFTGVVAAPKVGDAAVLRREFELRTIAAVTAPQILSGVTLVLGLFMLVLAAKRPGERTLGYFGIASLMYFGVLLNWVFIVAPIERANWFAVEGFALQGVNVSTFIFALRYGGWRWPKLEPGLWATVPLIALGDRLQAHGIELPVDWSWVQSGVLSGYILVFAVVAFVKRTLESLALFLASPGCLLDGVLGANGLPPDFVSLLPYSFLLLFTLIGSILVNRFARSLGEAESLNTELEQRVSQKRVELEQNHEKLRTLEQQQAVAAERQRIMSDMHDGIGGQLISTLSLVEHGQASNDQVAAALRECIDDIRLTIDSLEPADDELLPMLGNLRYRLEARLKQQGIGLDWRVQDVPRLACLTPQNLLHILRILQEAFTNILKHAQADRISVDTVVEGGHVSIRVSDNGRGFGEARGGTGHGLTNMLDRARRIGGDLRVQPSAAGTTISLLLPIG